MSSTEIKEAASAMEGEAGPRRRSPLIFLAPLILFGGLAIVFGIGLFSGDASRVPSALIGKAAPAITLTPVEGLQRDGQPVPAFGNADLGKGRATLVNVFASWCAPCKVEHPVLVGLSQTDAVKQGKVALITGAGSGIGRASAERLLQHGYRVVLAGRRREPLELVPVTEAGQLDGVRDGTLDMAIVRLPVDDDGMPRPLAIKRVTMRDPEDPRRYWVEADNQGELGVADSWTYGIGSLARDQIRALVLFRDTTLEHARRDENDPCHDCRLLVSQSSCPGTGFPRPVATGSGDRTPA